MPDFSIILPVRNAAEFLDEAIASSLAQTIADLELCVIINGSIDASEEIARRWAERDPRVKVLFSPPEHGIVGALNLGWRSAASPILMRMDADDIMAPNRAEVQLALLEQRPDLDAVSGKIDLIEPLGEGMSRYVEWANSLETADQIAAARFIECPVIHPSITIRRDALVRHGGYRETPWAEDHELWLRILESGGRIGKVPETILAWRDRPGRLTRTDPRFAEEQVWRMKAHFISRLPVMIAYGVAIAGAGPIGKRLARLLVEEGIEVKGLFDVSPKRVGQTINGLEVASADEIGGRWREAVLLGAVGVDGGREKVRAVAQAAGYTEGRDFWSCC